MKKFILLLFGLQCSLCSITSAQNPGDLDNSFGSGGLLTTIDAPWFDIAIQPDGKLLAVSSIIARFNTDGSLDGTFSNDGIDTLKINDTIYWCNAVAIQPDGKVLVAGGPAYVNAGLKDFLLIRYNPDGTRDSSFNGDGVVRTDFNSGSDDYGYELAIQTDGKIIVAGASNSKLALSRYQPDGSLDNTFDNDGKLVVNSINADPNDGLVHVAYMKVQADGKILAGSSNVIARLNPDGSQDNSFGNSGLVALSQGMRDIAIQPDGKIAFAGSSSVGIGFGVVRLNTNGSFDSDFGNGGVVNTSGHLGACGMFPEQTATSIVLQPDGRILAGGYNMCGAANDCRNFVLIRYDPNGSLDSSFGTDGQVVTSLPQFYCQNESHASVITPDLKIILAGHHSLALDSGYLARYHLGWLLDVNTLSEPNENFAIAPNPTADWIEIEATDIENGVWHLQLRDITGRTILQEDIAVTSGSIQKKISLDFLSTGVYVLQLDNGKRKSVSRLVKNR